MRQLFTLILVLLFSAVLSLSTAEALPRRHQLRMVLEPKEKVLFSAEVDASILEIPKQMGDAAEEGDVLLRLKPVIFEGEKKKAEAKVARAQVEYEARSRLFIDKVASFVEMRQAEAAVKEAEGELQIATARVDSCSIKSPFPCQVTDVRVKEYEFVEAATPLMEIINDRVLVGKILVPASLASSIALDQEFRVSFPNTSISATARITRINPAINPASGTIKVDAEIDNSDGKIRAGTIGMVTLVDRSALTEAPS